VIHEEISSVTDDFDASWFLVVSTYSIENLMVGEEIIAFDGGFPCGIPSLEEFIVVLELEN